VISSCGIFGRQSGTGTGFLPRIAVFPCQFHSIGVPLHEKMKKELFTFITGFHSKPPDCGASVASGAAPFTTIKKSTLANIH
jgi:hypothetical protein